MLDPEASLSTFPLGQFCTAEFSAAEKKMITNAQSATFSQPQVPSNTPVGEGSNPVTFGDNEGIYKVSGDGNFEANSLLFGIGSIKSKR